MTPNKIAFPMAAAVLAGSAFLAAPNASATVTIAASFQEKVEKADAIVLGRVMRQETRFDDEKRFILTYTTFQVEKAFKGGVPPEVTIVTPGGRIGELQQTTVGVPEFERGDENVVFVGNTRRGPTVLWFDQGAYDVVREGGERIVRPVATEAVHLDAQRGIAAAPEPARTLREFEAAVQRAEQRTRQQRMDLLEQDRRRVREEASVWRTIERNKWLVLFAALGAIMATLHFIRRS